MGFVEQHWDYINQTASVHAIEIATLTRRWMYLEDYKQEMIIYLVKNANKYNAKKSKPATFINMVLHSSKSSIIRHHYRHKNQIIDGARNIDVYLR